VSGKEATMKVTVDRDKCQGYGQCAEVAPTVFSLDDWGFSIAENDGEVAPGDEGAARDAVKACPAQAITAS
jgi:ferredoxin